MTHTTPSRAIRHTHRRLAVILATLALILAGIGAQLTLQPGTEGAGRYLAPQPAAAVHTNQKFCSSSNSTGTLIVWGAGYQVLRDYRYLARGECLYLASRSVPTVEIEVDGYQFRVGYDYGPYRAWQPIPGMKVFRPSDNDVIYFDVRR